MADFERLVKAAHADGIKVILDMVINHTSDQNPWFNRRAESGQSLPRLVLLGSAAHRSRREEPMGRSRVAQAG
ncbi:Glycosyl hydrolase, family 13, catalytic region domain protein [mine drainage metagenome]|uniref:Glycosyl hydrolase, family 13, catalytic region domain protein n=1 Tax=mine drainage metagenome TaxID=410659 RepID=T1AVS5_9ZZZZ